MISDCYLPPSNLIIENNSINMSWIKIKDKKPSAYLSGGWDGKKSDKVLLCTLGGRYYVAEMYEGILDRSEFCYFYDDNDFEIENVVLWTEICNPF